MDTSLNFTEDLLAKLKVNTRCLFCNYKQEEVSFIKSALEGYKVLNMVGCCEVHVGKKAEIHDVTFV